MTLKNRRNERRNTEDTSMNNQLQNSVCTSTESSMISINHVSKKYVLGQIGGTTLRDELQRLHAKIHRREDPTKAIGAERHSAGETFLALQDVSFDIFRGERVGIIGRNGAGKSTLLKLISRVTAPTSGWIGLNGRVASMLEVGTGFHMELTGRENIFMNGAILGMTRREIDRKLEDIIEFSECRQFIDTPVKRYSSGMFVKLAFAVAAHLDSEIMIMDEVLAVGDVAFQKKCLNKMGDVSRENGRTILYVSHNMSTIRELCTRCIVLDQGKVIFNGDVQEGITIYTQNMLSQSATTNDLSGRRRRWCNGQMRLLSVELREKEMPIFTYGETMKLRLTAQAIQSLKNVSVRIEFTALDRGFFGATLAENVCDTDEETKIIDLSFDTSQIVPGQYDATLVLYQKDEYRRTTNLDMVSHAFAFEIADDQGKMPLIWQPEKWGRVILNPMWKTE